MGGGDDCFLSDIWISLAALGTLTQEWQLPCAQALPRPLRAQAPHRAPSSAGHGGTGDNTLQTSLKGVTSPIKNVLGVVEAEGL